MIAFIDETQVDAETAGIAKQYVLVAAAVLPEAVSLTRERLRRILLPRQRRLHWNEERPARRDRIVHAISRMDVYAYAAVAGYQRRTLEQRARASCFQRLLPDLERRGIRQVVIERRDEHLNRADRQTISAMIRYEQLRPEFRYRFGLPNEEPLLWLPDALAGAIREDMCGTHAYIERLRDRAPKVLPT